MLTSFFEKSIMDQKVTFEVLPVHFSVSNNMMDDRVEK